MDAEIRHKIGISNQTQDAEWEEIVAAIPGLNQAMRRFLHEHPPGLVKALWNHFDATRISAGAHRLPMSGLSARYAPLSGRARAFLKARCAGDPDTAP